MSIHETRPPRRSPPPAAGDPCLRIGVLPLPNFTMIAFAGLIDTLRLAADEGDRSRPKACSWTIIVPQLRPVRAGRRKKLDVAKRREIAESVITGRKSGAEMARLYNVSQPTVSRIVAAHRTPPA